MKSDQASELSKKTSKEASKAAFFALIAAMGMIANHIAGKATRDAVFLSIFDVEAIANMLMVASVTSLLAVFVVTRLIAKRGPQVVIPLAFFISGGLFLLEGLLVKVYPKVGAVSLYLHIATVGVVLISGFWSVINEKFDPLSAKKYVGRIAGGATVGGLLGGLLAERVAAMGESTLMIPILAGLHTLSGLMLMLASKGERQSAKESPVVKPPSGTSQKAWTDYLNVLKSPYLRNMGLLILLVTSSGTIIDYIMKDQAVLAYGKGDELLRFFALFYTGVGLASLVVQFTLTRWFLQRFGNAAAVSTVPGVLTFGGLIFVFLPGVATAVIARATEMFLRNSIYRSGYELLYTPVSKTEKRSGKMLVDVGVDRLADAVGGGLISLMIFLLAKSSVSTALAILAGLLGLAAYFVSRHLFKGYVGQLEKNLENQPDVDEEEIQQNAQRMVETMGAIKYDLSQYLSKDSIEKEIGPTLAPVVEFQEEISDPKLRDLQVLSGHDEAAIIDVLEHRGENLEPSAYPHLISLLAWDPVYEKVIQFLRARIGKIEGQLIDHLLDRDEDFVIRRRIPRVLQVSQSQRVIDGLLEATSDRRFEVRYQASAALQAIRHRNHQISFEKEFIYQAVLREIQQDRGVWSRQKVLDDIEERNASDQGVDKEVKKYIAVRAGRSMDYVFRLLSLIFPEKALMVAYHGLYTDDVMLRGTSLEYLNSILPDSIKEKLWPFFDEEYIAKTSFKSTEEIQRQLMETQHSVQVKLDQLRRESP